jgi:hypothetical protein
MPDPRTFILNPQSRQRCADWVLHEAPEGWRVTGKPSAKSRDQEARYHAMLNDIAAQTTYAGRKWDREDTKRILIDEFAEEMRQAGTPLHHDEAGRLIPSEDGRRIIQLGIQSRKFWVKEASAFIEFLFAWGAARGVVWSDESRQAMAAR